MGRLATGAVVVAMLVAVLMVAYWRLAPMLDSLDEAQRSAKVSNPYQPGEAPQGDLVIPDAHPNPAADLVARGGSDTGHEDAVDEKTRSDAATDVASSYIALLRTGRATEAWGYLPEAVRKAVPAAKHALW